MSVQQLTIAGNKISKGDFVFVDRPSTEAKKYFFVWIVKRCGCKKGSTAETVTILGSRYWTRDTDGTYIYIDKNVDWSGPKIGPYYALFKKVVELGRKEVQISEVPGSTAWHTSTTSISMKVLDGGG